MAKITAADVNKLRKQTGAGMMDCKKALVESDGDFEKAIDYLRKKGQKVAAKRSDRDAGEGVVLAKVSADNTFGAAIMVNCETDFVAKNEDFVAYTQSLLDAAIENKVASTEELKALTIDGKTVEVSLTEQIGKIGEKIEIGAYSCKEGAFLNAYIHPGNRLATVVEMSKAIDGISEVSKDVAMQVAAMNPVALNKDSVSQDVIDRELEVAKDQIRQEGKPENMVEKIAMGKLNKFFKENTLLSQSFIKDSKIDVETYVKQLDKDLTVSSFIRLALA
jgi:elongation factor Ts